MQESRSNWEPMVVPTDIVLQSNSLNINTNVTFPYSSNLFALLSVTRLLRGMHTLANLYEMQLQYQNSTPPRITFMETKSWPEVIGSQRIGERV